MTVFTGRPTITTTFTGRSTVSTVLTGRNLSPGVTNTVEPIITGIWNDLATWNETGKFWNDSGDIAGYITPVFTGRIIPA